MEFLPSKKLTHAIGLSLLISKFGKPLEDTVIEAIKTENQIKNVLNNTVREFHITLEEIRLTSRNDDFLLKMKDQITGKNEGSNYSQKWRIKLQAKMKDQITGKNEGSNYSQKWRIKLQAKMKDQITVKNEGSNYRQSQK